jgi:hypothetical protein
MKLLNTVRIAVAVTILAVAAVSVADTASADGEAARGVSDAPQDLRAKRRDLETHDVNERILDFGGILGP